MDDSAQILPACGWPCDQLGTDYLDGQNVWRETSEDFFWRMLEAVPPRAYESFGFVAGEAYTHTATGTVYCTCFEVRGSYFAKYVEYPRGVIPRLTIPEILLRVKGARHG